MQKGGNGVKEKLFAETKEEISETQTLNKLLDIVKSGGNNLQHDVRQADAILSNRLENHKTIPDIQPTTVVKPMEMIYSLNWAKLKDCKDLHTCLNDCNPNYKNGREWRINCQRCVPTYEMRRRGYDVTAKPKPQEVTPSDLSYSPFDVWQNPDIIRCGGNGKADIEREMKKWGDGARAQIVVTWKNTNSGHTFVAEQIDGKTVYLDPQTGSQDVSNYFSRVENGSVRFCRMDNLDVTNKILDCSRKV